MLTVPPLAVCDCGQGVTPERANDLQGVTEYMCVVCGAFFPALQPGESWEPWANETASAYAARVQSYLTRVNGSALS